MTRLGRAGIYLGMFDAKTRLFIIPTAKLGLLSSSQPRELGMVIILDLES